MRTFLHSLLIAVVTGTAAFGADAAAPISSFDETATFIKSNLIGKTLETRVTTKIQGGLIETEFNRREMFVNFVGGTDWMEFDAIILIQQKLWDLDEAGKRTHEEPRIKDRALAIRYGFHENKSKREAIGSSRSLTTSIDHSRGGGATAYRANVKDSILTMRSSSALYSDGFGKGGEWIPIATDTTVTYSIVDGQLHATGHEVGYSVDPETLERKPNGHDVTLKMTEVRGLTEW